MRVLRIAPIFVTLSIALAALAQPPDGKTLLHESSVLNGVGVSHVEAGRLDLAESALAKALSIRESVLGPDHRDVATSLNNLAAVYRRQGRYAESAALYARAIAIREKERGPEHPDVALTLHNLAAVHDAQDRFEQAEPLYRRSLAIREKALPPDHQDVAASLTSLGEIYLAQRKFDRAEPLLLRAFDIRRKLPEKHPDRMAAERDLWTLYMSTERFALAEQYQQAGQVTPNEAQRRRMAMPPPSPKGVDPTIR